MRGRDILKRLPRTLPLALTLGLLGAACSDTEYTLHVVRSGNASGLVTSDPRGIDCGVECRAQFRVDSTVTLTATPGPGALFTGWSEACTGTGPCMVKIDAPNKRVVASFGKAHSLTVVKEGSGTVVSSPEAIDCGPTCSALLLDGTTTTLTATPAPGWAFTGWSGGCTGTGTCRVTIQAATRVTATFTELHTLAVTRNGMGTVTSTPAGVDCGATCSATFLKGTEVRLNATPAAGWVLASWSGACSGSGACVVPMNGDKAVTANFVPTYLVTVMKTGMGLVVSTPTGINCGATCSARFPSGTMLTLSAMPTAGWVFTGWTGPCTGTGACTVTVEDAITVQATFVPAHPLAVRRAGAGMGAVTSTPAGIDCGTSCNASYPVGTKVTLSATPAAGSIFASWSGSCTGTGPCELTMDAAKSVTATFEPIEKLTVMKTGSGSGAVVSMPAGIDCGSTCESSFPRGARVTLTATAAAGSAFLGWGGACMGTDSCVVTLDMAKMVTANFGPGVALSVSKEGTGAGQVVSTPRGINCGQTCNAFFAAGSVVSLTATPAMGSLFTGWSGACAGAGACMLTLDAAKSVTATFEAAYELTVMKAGPGKGTVKSMPAGIDCGNACTAPLASGTLVTLTATPDMGWVFAGWSGACTGTGACMLTMDGAKMVTATFAQNFSLTVTKLGSGTVTSFPPGIDCGTNCNSEFTGGTNVTLTAAPADKFVFSGWSGPCSGTGTCTLTIDEAKSVSATFIPDLAFVAPKVVAAGAGPMCLAVGDVNGDDKPDLAVSNNGAASVSVLLNDGLGTFGAPTDVAVGPNPLGIVMGHFDDADPLDLAVVSAGANNVSVLSGDGTGVFMPAGSPGAGSSPIAIASADLNADAKNDLVVVATSGSANVTVLLRNEMGGFHPGVGFAAGNTPQSVAIADVNGDQKLDLVVANLGSRDVSILLGRGDGTFQTATSTGAGMAPRSVALGDVDLDGNLDVVVADSGSHGVAVLRGRGNGTFRAATLIATGTGARGVAIADLNGDGRPDVVTANETGASVSVLLGSGTPALFIAPRNLTVSASPTAVVVGDLNSDGKPDVAVGHASGASVTVLLQQ